MSKQKSVLGKGLSALIPGASGDDETIERVPQPRQLSTERVIESPKEPISLIALSAVAANPLQPRKDFDNTQLEELADSIREHGIIQPITVRQTSRGTYEIVSGERRVRAARLAGLTQIPAYRIDIDDDRTMLELAIIENIERAQLNPIEEAEAYERLIRECGLSQDELATRMSRDRTTISNFLRLLRLPESVRNSLRNGNLGMGHAKAVMALGEPAEQETLWKLAVQEHMSVRKLEELVRATIRRSEANGNAAPPKAGRPMKPVTAAEAQSQEISSIEHSLKQHLATQVKLRTQASGAGELVIQFFSRDELERIVELLLSIEAD